MHHGAQQGPALSAGCRAEGEPSEDFRLRHRPPKRLPQDFGQFLECLWRLQFLVQAEDQFVAGEGIMQGLRPAGVVCPIQFAACQGTVGCLHGHAVLGVLHRFDAMVEYFGGVSIGAGGRVALGRPNFGFVVFAHRGYRIRWNAEETRRKVEGCLRVLPIDDGGGCGDAGGAAGTLFPPGPRIAGKGARRRGTASRRAVIRRADICFPRRMPALLGRMAERPQAADEAGGFRP